MNLKALNQNLKYEAFLQDLSQKKDRKIDSPVGIKLQAVTKEVFRHRRKMVGKSLKKILTPKQLEKMDIDLSLRPENLTVEEYIKIAQALI